MNDTIEPSVLMRTVLSDQRSAQPPVSVRVLTTESDFSALAVQWNAVHAQAAAASVFNSWTWQFRWWQVYGRDQPLRVLVACEGDALVGVLALYVHKSRELGVQLRALRLVGTGGDTHPDDLGPVLAPGREAGAAHALAEAVLRLDDADAVLLTDIDPRSAFPRAMEHAAHSARLFTRRGVSERIAFVDLPASWEGFLASLTGNRRSRIRVPRRKLAAAHAARFFVWDDAAQIERALERLTALHRKRWEQAGRESESFASAEYLRFHLDIIKSFFPRGWLRLYCLEIDGAIEAMTYCYRFRNRIYLVQAGFNPAMAKLKPGSVLLGHALEHAIGEGNEVFDFLRGAHRYKDELATGFRETQSVSVCRRSLAGLAYRLRRIHLPLWMQRLRETGKGNAKG